METEITGFCLLLLLFPVLNGAVYLQSALFLIALSVALFPLSFRLPPAPSQTLDYAPSLVWKPRFITQRLTTVQENGSFNRFTCIRFFTPFQPSHLITMIIHGCRCFSEMTKPK